MKEEYHNAIKLIAANISSWGGTYIAVIELKDVSTVVSILAAFASVCVSFASIRVVWRQGDKKVEPKKPDGE